MATDFFSSLIFVIFLFFPFELSISFFLLLFVQHLVRYLIMVISLLYDFRAATFAGYTLKFYRNDTPWFASIVCI